LPFFNMSRDPDDEYFSEGLADEILDFRQRTTPIDTGRRGRSFCVRARITAHPAGPPRRVNTLSHIPGLRVTARTSSFAFRGKEEDIRRIPGALGVRTILEGRVRRGTAFV
jgi:adenylate cyclase